MGRLYKNMEIYYLGYELALKLYKLTEQYPAHELQNLTFQVRKSAVSLPLNVAEGSSRRTRRAFLQFLNYSYGSAKELEVLLSISKDLKYLSEEDYGKITTDLDKYNAKLFCFMRDLEKKIGCYRHGFFRKYVDDLGQSNDKTESAGTNEI